VRVAAVIAVVMVVIMLGAFFFAGQHEEVIEDCLSKCRVAHELSECIRHDKRLRAAFFVLGRIDVQLGGIANRK
jgi:hypothetical protein